MTRLGFVGVGAMGAPMIARLSAAGLRVAAHDADAGRAAAVAGQPGVTAATRLADLAGAPVVALSLPSSEVVSQVVAGPGGLLEVLAPGALIVDMGSSDPRQTVALAAAAEGAGLELVDAPVSGGVAGAVSGRLTAMFGGRPDQLERCRPLLDAIGDVIVPTGAVGSGHAMKALNNLLSAVGLAAAGEVLEAATRFGLDPPVVVDVLNRSTGRNHATEHKLRQRVLSGTYDSGFALRLMLKDVSTAVSLAREEGLDIPIGEACLARWREAAERLPADADHTRIAMMPALGAGWGD